MNEGIREMLNEEITEEFQALSQLEPGSKEHSAAVEDLSKLYRLVIDQIRSETESDEKYERRIMEDESNKRDEDFKKIQLTEQMKDRYFRLGIAAAELVLPLIFYGVWMKKGFQFEETGAYTSTTFRGLFNRFRPTKK